MICISIFLASYGAPSGCDRLVVCQQAQGDPKTIHYGNYHIPWKYTSITVEPSSKEVQGISFTHSDRGIYPGDVIVPIVNCLRVSLGLLAHHQPVTA